MTPLIATAPALTPAEVSTFYGQTALLEKMTPANCAPWLYSAVAQVRELEENGALIAGLGDFRVSDRTAATTRLLLSLISVPELPVLSVRDLPVPVVSPVSGGAISLIWSLGSKEVKFSCYPDGQAAFFRCQDDDVIEDGRIDLSAPDSARGALNWMMQP